MRRFWKNQQGVTMIEVLVTIAILAIVVVPCLSAFVMAQRGNVKAAETTNAYTAAANLMEELKGGIAVFEDGKNRIVREVEENNVTITAVRENKGSYVIVEIYLGIYPESADLPDGEPILKGVIVP